MTPLIKIALFQFSVGDQTNNISQELSEKLHKLGPCQKLLTTKAIPNIKQHLLQVDKGVLTKFITAITEGHICTPDEQDERLLLSLKKGGLAIPIFAEIADFEYENSQSTTHQLVRNIKCQESTAALDKELLKQIRNSIVKAREERNTTILQQLHGRMNKEQLRANELNTMRGASSWLTTLQVQSENLNLNKREFFDIPLDSKIPANNLSCLKGGFVHRRHDESHLNQKLNTAFTASENEKKRQCNQVRVTEIEHGPFTPLVFTPYESGAREAERCIAEFA
ncbi:hypothetical protein P5673_012432 [Acropora cervicornis]|uniref:Uncharacterized protein n=1 Tax=Acropora cervicornis TaxID=6130 RepID=A0AAD9QN49_ACRCE|nr:hypothetical protein P5673_012432 [Acropora cervicornis]